MPLFQASDEEVTEDKAKKSSEEEEKKTEKKEEPDREAKKVCLEPVTLAGRGQWGWVKQPRREGLEGPERAGRIPAGGQRGQSP